MYSIPDGVYPVMLTPFNDDLSIDYQGVEGLMAYYRRSGCEGIFAICASSEMDALTLEEKVELSKFITDRKGDMTIVTSGHSSVSYEGQLEEMNALAETGIDAQIFIVSRLTRRYGKEGEYAAEAMLENTQRLVEDLSSDLPLGIYERPGEGNMPVPAEVIRYCVQTGRFVFLKDTTCTVEGMRDKLEWTKGSGFKLYNANTTFLYETLKMGAAGYSGTCANHHADLFVWLCKNWQKHPEAAQRLSYYLGVLGQATSTGYRASAKYYLNKYETPMHVHCRDSNKRLTDQVIYLQDGIRYMQEELRDWLAALD